MSALNVITGPSIWLVTDGAFYRDSDRTVGGFGPKVMTMPHLDAAVAAVGPAGLVHLIGEIFYHAGTTLDELLESNAVATAMANAARVAASGVTLRIVVAGHSRRHGPAAWHLAGDTLERVPGNFYMSPSIEDFEPAGGSMAEFEASMVALVGRQRELGPVGGFVAATVIQAGGGIVQKILHRWHDRIGDRLGTAPAAAA
jgi:hypothetical protein